MKVLVLSITAGQGHNAAAKNITTKLDELGVETKVIDCFKNYSKFWYWCFDGLYLKLSLYAPTLLFERPYRATINAGPERKNKGLSLVPIKRVCKKLSADIASYQPDVIVCTHPNAARVPVEMKRFYDNVPKVVSICTDYTCHPIWEKSYDEVDYMITSSSELDEKFFKKGYKPEQMRHFGFPTKDEFSKPKNKQELRKKYGLDPDKTTIMIFYGGYSVGRPSDMVKNLHKIEGDFQMIFVAGNNKKEKARVDKYIKKGLSKKVICFGFSNVIHELMGASDYIVGKLGMGVVSECLNSQTPLIAVGKMYAQERDNLNFLLEHNAILYIPHKKFFAAEMSKVLKQPEILTKLREGVDDVRKPNAASDIANFVAGLGEKKVLIARKQKLKNKKQV